MTYIDPAKLSDGVQNVMNRWMAANGCRHYIALEPIFIRGNVIEYTALCRRDSKSLGRHHPMAAFYRHSVKRKRLHLRVPLGEFLKVEEPDFHAALQIALLCPALLHPGGTK